MTKTGFDKLYLAVYDAGCSLQGCEFFDSFFGSRGIARAGYDLGTLLDRSEDGTVTVALDLKQYGTTGGSKHVQV